MPWLNQPGLGAALARICQPPPGSRKLMSKHLNRFTPAALQASLEARQARADASATNLAPFIAELPAAGVTSQRAIAVALNERGVPTGQGRRRQLLARLPA
jgi:hypothetical protein